MLKDLISWAKRDLITALLLAGTAGLALLAIGLLFFLLVSGKSVIPVAQNTPAPTIVVVFTSTPAPTVTPTPLPVNLPNQGQDTAPPLPPFLGGTSPLPGSAIIAPTPTKRL